MNKILSLRVGFDRSGEERNLIVKSIHDQKKVQLKYWGDKLQPLPLERYQMDLTLLKKLFSSLDSAVGPASFIY